LAIALIIRSDVSGRAAATVETYRSRAAVADAFLQLAAGAQLPRDPQGSNNPSHLEALLATLAGTGKLRVRLADGDKFHHVSSATKTEDGLQLKIAGIMTPIDSIKDFELSD
jgi:hypothetical protein